MKKVLDPVFVTFDALTAPVNFESLVPQILDVTIDAHRNNANIHEALHAMTASDEAVNIKFIELEDKMTVRIADKLTSLGVDTNAINEKIHLAIGIVQSFAHECIFDRHEYLDYEKMRSICINTIKSIFV